MSPLNRCVEDGWIFGVGDVAGDVREIAVWLAVKGEDFDSLETVSCECRANG